MSRSRATPTPKSRAFKVGERVRINFRGRRIRASIVEDRGPIGAGGRRLYAVRVVVDRSIDLERVFELPADEIHAA